MPREDKKAWKASYFEKIITNFEEFDKTFIVGVDNVGSKQMQQIRMALRGKAVVLMGKNTRIRKALRDHLPKNPLLEKILPHVKGNVGFVFTRDDLIEVRNAILQNRVQAPARAGAIAPLDVHLPPQNTGLGPEKTSFFQALQIPTKISKGTIEILNEIHLIKKDTKVGASEATLLNMLNISPFTYGLKILQVYDSGNVFSPDILDVTPEDMRAKFMVGVRNIAALSLAINYPTLVSIPHSLINGFKKLLAVSIEIDYTPKEAETVKEYLKDPSKFATASPVSAAPAAAATDAKKEEKKEESEESGDDMGFALFD